MAPKKITAKEFARLNGHTQANTEFVINKLYDTDDSKTPKQWESQMVKDKVIDQKIK